jgi:iron complex outermembrane receptor protein
MASINRFAAIASVVALGPMCSKAADEPPQPPDSDVLETIVVTADKRQEKLTDVPMSVTALAGVTLDNLQDRSFSDYAPLVPGLSINSSQPGLTRLTLRGQNVGGDGSTVAVYVDEAPFGSSAALSNGGISTGDFDTFDLQRVEVLRGPQGTLYGSNSEGGLLKFVTNAPVLGSFSGAAEVNGETTDNGGHGADVHAMVNLPLGDILALRVSAFDKEIPGFIDDPLYGKTDINEGHESGGRASLLAQPTDALTIRLTATLQESRYGGVNTVDVDPISLHPLYGDLEQERFISEPSEIKYENYNATVNWNAGPFSVLSTTSYNAVTTDTVTDYTSVVVAPPSTTLGDLLGELVGPNLGGRLDDNVETRKFTQEVRLFSPTSSLVEWQVGAYFTHEIADLVENLDAVEIPSAIGVPVPALEVPELASDYKEWAGFADLTYHFNSQLSIEGGLRYSRNEQSATENLSGLLVPTETFSTPSAGHVVTYSVAPQWHLDENSMLYARVATGYRPGGPNALPPAAPPTIPREYGADRTTNYELGARSTQLDGRLSIDIAAFIVNWTNVQLLEDVDQTGIDGNGGTARSEGVEWKFEFIPVRGLYVQWDGAYTDAHLTSPAPAVNAQSGAPLPYVPKWSTALNGDYTWPLFADYKGFVGATWSFVGTRSTDFASSPTATQLQLPSYDTVDLRLGLDQGHYRASLYAKNLADAHGITSYFTGVAPNGAADVTVIQPRTIGITLSAKF